MIRRRGLLLCAPALLAASALRAQSLVVRQDDYVAPGWARGVLIRWGDRVTFDAPDWNPDYPSREAASAQFGWDARMLAVISSGPQADNVPRALLAVGHPTVNAAMAFREGRDRPEIAGAMQGVSIVNLERRGTAWKVVDGGFQNRRFDARTLCRNGADGGPLTGIAGVTGGCATPWGTLLLAEGAAAGWRQRLPGLEPGAVGMLVEFDPTDPGYVPVKHAAPGRFGPVDVAAALSADGRAVVWITDGRPGGYLYRFVSDAAAGIGALDSGRMAAARIEGGSLRWVPLQPGDPMAAARNAGATAFDMPAGLAYEPGRKRLCLAVSGGAGRVLDLRMAAGDAAAETGVAETLLEGRASPLPAGRRGDAPQPVPAWPWAPAVLAFDAEGGVLVGTDRGNRPGALPEALYRLPAGGGTPALLHAAPAGAASGGAAVAPDGTVLAAVAHPGATPGATWANPATRWPNMQPDEPPRSTVVTLAR